MEPTQPASDAIKSADAGEPKVNCPKGEITDTQQKSKTPALASKGCKSLPEDTKQIVKDYLNNLTSKSGTNEATNNASLSDKQDEVDSIIDIPKVSESEVIVKQQRTAAIDVSKRSVIEQLLTEPNLPHLEIFKTSFSKKIEAQTALFENQDIGNIVSEKEEATPSTSAEGVTNESNDHQAFNKPEIVDESSIMSTSSVGEKEGSVKSVRFEADSFKSEEDDGGSEKGDEAAVSSAEKSEGKKKGRRRGSAWSDDETDFLMEIWARQVDLFARKENKAKDETATCAATYRLIAKEMAMRDGDKSAEQCKTRIHTLKRAYKITKDEIDSGSQTITYCRHFDKLEIIHQDNPNISPGVLASTLEEKRKAIEAGGKPRKRTPVKRKLTVGEPPAHCKRTPVTLPAHPQGNTLPPISTFNKPMVMNDGNVDESDSQWGPFGVHTTESENILMPAAQTSILQRSLSMPATVPKSRQDPPPYHQYNNQIPTQGIPIKTEVNNNMASIKSEYNNQSGNQTGFAQPWNSIPPASLAQNNANQSDQCQGQSQQNDLERMRISLEMKKLEVERNKIEMEERQRREERDHQYRMMQLLLVGLGQQNIPQILSGQGSEVTHAHGPDFSRFLESGLVPGGQQTVNEKGLSFSEL